MNHKTILPILAVFSLLSCNEIDKLTQFKLNYDEEVIITSTTGINLPININTPDIESNSESSFAINDTRKDLIEEITLNEMELTLTSPSGEDFSFLESISIYISAEGLNEEKIAWKEQISDDTPVNRLVLDTSNMDLKEYIKKDKFSLRVNTVTDEVLTEDHHIDIHSVFFVDAKVLGI